jgi:hypothetical protein
MPLSVPHTARGHTSHAPGRQATNFGTLAPNILNIIIAVLSPYKNVYRFARTEQNPTRKPRFTGPPELSRQQSDASDFGSDFYILETLSTSLTFQTT